MLDKCSACGGFVAPRSPKCPHCATASTVKLGVGTTLLGGAIAFTLMACYGMPPQPRGPEIVPPTPEPTGADAGSPIEPVPSPTTAVPPG
jgi:hypothetical protein